MLAVALKRSSLLLLAVLAGCGGMGLRQDFGALEPPRIAVGDRWVYRVINGYNKEPVTTVTHVVTAVTPEHVEVRVTEEPGGTFTRRFDPSWNPQSGIMPPGLPVGFGFEKTLPTGARVDYAPAFPAFRFPLAPGQHWSSRITVTDPSLGRSIEADVTSRVQGLGQVSTPAGQFDAVKVRHDVYFRDAVWWRTQTWQWFTEWYAPAVNNVVLRDGQAEYRDYTRIINKAPEIMKGDWLITQLVEYSHR